MLFLHFAKYVLYLSIDNKILFVHPHKIIFIYSDFAQLNFSDIFDNIFSI